MVLEHYVYLNGQIIERSLAHIDIEDRGFLFGDGVYEAVAYFHGLAFEYERHLERFIESLDAIEMKHPAELQNFNAIGLEVMRQNKLTNARIYWQVTRGTSPRDHVIPKRYTPTVLLMADPLNLSSTVKQVDVILWPDLRWKRCGIKSIQLLPNVLAKTKAHEAGAYEAILHRENIITEGSSTGVFLVRDGKLQTHPADGSILDSITRQVLLELAAEIGLTCQIEPFDIKAFKHADEAFLVSTTTLVASIGHVDDWAVGNGQVGPVTQKLFDAFYHRITGTS